MHSANVHTHARRGHHILLWLRAQSVLQQGGARARVTRAHACTRFYKDFDRAERAALWPPIALNGRGAHDGDFCWTPPILRCCCCTQMLCIFAHHRVRPRPGSRPVHCALCACVCAFCCAHLRNGKPWALEITLSPRRRRCFWIGHAQSGQYLNK